jgi:hypothetical protein
MFTPVYHDRERVFDFVNNLHLIDCTGLANTRVHKWTVMFVWPHGFNDDISAAVDKT